MGKTFSFLLNGINHQHSLQIPIALLIGSFEQNAKTYNIEFDLFHMRSRIALEHAPRTFPLFYVLVFFLPVTVFFRWMIKRLE